MIIVVKENNLASRRYLLFVHRPDELSEVNGLLLSNLCVQRTGQSTRRCWRRWPDSKQFLRFSSTRRTSVVVTEPCRWDLNVFSAYTHTHTQCFIFHWSVLFPVGASVCRGRCYRKYFCFERTGACSNSVVAFSSSLETLVWWHVIPVHWLKRPVCLHQGSYRWQLTAAPAEWEGSVRLRPDRHWRRVRRPGLLQGSSHKYILS